MRLIQKNSISHFFAYFRLNLCQLSLVLLILLAGCATPFAIVEQHYQLMPPTTIKQPATILLSIDHDQNGQKQTWEAVLNVDAKQIDLIILGTLGRRLATLGFDGHKVTIKQDSAVDIRLKNLLGQLQMIYWPLAVLKNYKWNKNWRFEEKDTIRSVYFQQQQVAEIHRQSSSLWNGEFEYFSKISNEHLSIRSSQLNR